MHPIGPVSLLVGGDDPGPLESFESAAEATQHLLAPTDDVGPGRLLSGDGKAYRQIPLGTLVHPNLHLVPFIVPYSRSGMTEIRALHSEDWRDIRDIRLRSLADAPDAFTSTYEHEESYDEARWRELATTGCWFAAVDGEPVGVAAGVSGWSGDAKKRELVGMWVAPSHRRRGVARELLNAVKTWAASEGATTLSLGVREGNEDAMKAYRRMGMRSSGETTPEWNRPTSVLSVMECDLVQA
jgi:GNAT superfamily N-acetyltransferase